MASQSVGQRQAVGGDSAAPPPEQAVFVCNFYTTDTCAGVRGGAVDGAECWLPFMQVAQDRLVDLYRAEARLDALRDAEATGAAASPTFDREEHLRSWLKAKPQRIR